MADSPLIGSSNRSNGRDVIVIGASAGGTAPLKQLLERLPADLPAALFVVRHMLPTAKSHLPDMLGRAGPLRCAEAEDHEPIRHGVVYVAAPDRHLIVKQGHVRVTRGPRENRWRPSIDVLFRSAALAYGAKAIAVVLSGMLDDGTSGLAAIKACGGKALVQAQREREAGREGLSMHYGGTADEARAHARVLREFLLRENG